MRHRPIALSVAALAAAAAAAGCGSTTIIKTVPARPAAAKPTANARPSAGTDGPALLGDLLTMSTGQTTLKVRVTGVLDPLPVGEFDSPDSGKRYVGVQVAVKNVGAHGYTDAIDDGATLLLADHEQADSTIVSGGPCGNGFGSDVKIAAGDKRVGCVAFEVPAHRKLSAFQLTPNSGLDDQTGQWRLPAVAPSSSQAGSTSSSTSASAPAPVPSAPSFTQCDQNISAQVGTTTCGFAENVFYEYWAHDGDTTLDVYSSKSDTFFTTLCTPGEGIVVCTTDDGGTVKFSQASIDAYTPDEAAAYASSHTNL